MKIKLTLLFMSVLWLCTNQAIAQNINTIAGGLGDNGAATSAELYNPAAIVVDRSGNVYIADQGNNTIRKVDASGTITIYAGIPGDDGYSGDGRPSVFAAIGTPVGLAIDTFGNLFIVDEYNNGPIRKVDTKGIISTYAGGGWLSTDGIPATNARLYTPSGIALDQAGNLYIAESGNNKIRKVGKSGMITTIAGTGTAGFYGENITAVLAKLNQPSCVCVDRSGNIFIADRLNAKVRKIDAAGIITTYAGNGGVGYAGDGGIATNANFNLVTGVAADTSGNIYIADDINNVIRRVNTSGIVSRVAGVFLSGGFTGDGGPANIAQLSGPTAVATDANGNYYIADYGNNRVRKVTPAGMISTLAGCSFHTSTGYKGDGGPAISALLDQPSDLAIDAAQNLYMADPSNHCVRMINSSGIIATVAGKNVPGFSGDNGPATAAKLSSPYSVTTDRKDNLYICDQGNKRIRKVNSAGIISTYAGNGSGVYGGDGHRADSVGFPAPLGIATDKYGALYVSDYSSPYIRKIDTNRIITTIAGNGVTGYFGDGGPATDAQIGPGRIYVDTSGNIYIAEQYNYRIRKINSLGIISTVAGNGTYSYSGDGVPATAEGIENLNGMALSKSGDLFFTSTDRILRINAAGIISTFSGGSSGSFFGDGGPATAALMHSPAGLVFDTSGNLMVADAGNNRIREIYNASIRISAPNDTLCGGVGAVFTAAVNAAPVYTPYYHWKKNDTDVGSNSSTYTSPVLFNGDVITCYITDGATGRAIAQSNKITIVVPSGIPSFGIACSPGPTHVCMGSIVNCGTNTVVNGGTVPVFDWFLNGSLVYTGSIYTFIPLNADVVYCRMTSSSRCMTTDTAISTSLAFTTYVNVPTINITVNTGSALCAGSLVTITPHQTNGGSPIFDWFKNSIYAATGNTYSYVAAKGDSVYCRLMSNAACISSDTALSNILTTDTPAIPLVSIVSDLGDTVCAGSKVKMTPFYSSGGATPSFEWYLNGSPAGSGTPYQFTPQNNDQLYCQMTSSAKCLLYTTALSDTITFTHTTPLPASVNISVSPADTVCEGAMVTFVANPVNGGTLPAYNWFINNHSQSSGGNTFSYKPGNDIVYCNLTSSACATPAVAISNSIQMVVQPLAIPTVNVSVVPGTVLCLNTPVTCLATSTNGGSAPVYDWYQNNSKVFTGEEYSFTPANGDRLYCMITSNGTCLSSQTAKSAGTMLHVNSLPEISIRSDKGQVVFRGNTSTFTADVPNIYGTDYKYQWIKNNVVIPGATDNSYSSSDFSNWDSIRCDVTISGACNGTASSNTLLVDTYHGIKLYPNPNNGNFVVNGNNYDVDGDAVNIRIFNSAGKLVYEKNTAYNTISFYADIQLGRLLPPGPYILRLRSAHDNLSFFFAIKY